MEQEKGTQLQQESFISWAPHYPLLLRGNSILEGTGDYWALGFAPLAPLMCPAGVYKVISLPIFSHIHLSPGLVLCAPPPIQRELGSMEWVTPKHVLFSMPQSPIFYSSNISLKQQHPFGLWKKSGLWGHGGCLHKGSRPALGVRPQWELIISGKIRGRHNLFNNFCLDNWISTIKRMKMDPFLTS